MSQEENIKNVITKDKSLREKSFIMDINMIEAPLFQFKNKRTIQTAKSLEMDPNISKEMKYVISTMPEESKNSQVEFLSWTDSKGLDREILAASIFKLPNAFAMDVFHALIGLYIKKNSPITYIEDEKVYNMPENKLEFRIYEICEFMKVSYGGKIYQKIKDAIRELGAVKYYSLGNGTFYNKRKEKYETSREKSISLISDYDFFQKGKDKSNERCEVIFGNLVVENIKFNYIKFLNDNIYFQLKSGITRRLYSYIEGNRYGRTYIKRSFDVLRYKIPIDFKYSSELKKRFKVPLENLIKFGVIKDYFYGNEILINGIKEDCIYIVFEGTRKQLIDSLTVKQVDLKEEKKKEVQEDYALEFPENIENELRNIGINESKIAELINKHNKWKLAEYILWIKDGIKKGDVKSPAGLFVFAITDEMVKVGSTHPHIVEFVEKIKKEVEGKKDIEEDIIKDSFNKYIEKEISQLKKEEEFVYKAIYNSTYDNISMAQPKKVKSLRQIYNMSEGKDKAKMLELVEKWEKFSVEKEESDIFKEELVKAICMYKGLQMYEDYRRNYMENNG